MLVTLVDSMGTELTVCNAARVSFAKKSEWDKDEVIEGNKEEYYHNQPYIRNVLSDKDKKLLSYLAKHGHWSPFSHPQIQLHVKAPIFIARQLAKHQVGLAWNEVSRRYVDSEPEFYTPENWRKKNPDKKQGSTEETIDEYIISDNSLEGTCGDPECCVAGPDSYMFDYKDLMSLCKRYYNEALETGICPEQLRMILPQSMYTEFFWTGSLYAFSRVYNLRSTPDAQKEVQEIAKQIGDIIEPLFPESWKALTCKSS